MTSSTYSWTVAHMPKYMDGHKIYRCIDPRDNQPMYAIADWSGTLPEDTDDGILWILPGESVRINNDLTATIYCTPDAQAFERVPVLTTLGTVLAMNKLGICGHLYHEPKVAALIELVFSRLRPSHAWPVTEKEVKYTKETWSTKRDLP